MIYFDSAATTLEKPRTVASAVSNAITRLASPGRGGYPAGMRAADVSYECRELAASLFHVPNPEQVVFTNNATHGLNIAIHSLIKSNTTVLISGYEHNAVTRPLCARPDIRLKVAAGPLFDSDGIYEAFERELTDDVSVVICNHVSNVFGFIQPIERIAALCRRRGVPLIVDASQSAGTMPVMMEEWGAAFIAMPGHKGLYGPQGTGLLLCGANTIPLLYGGTGSSSMKQDMPAFLPDRLEAGTHNMPGIAGLLYGMKFVRYKGIDRILEHEQRLNRHFMDGLSGVPGVKVFRGEGCQGGLCSLVFDGIESEAAAEMLAERGIAVRAGLHCAPLAHKTAGTVDTGTVRFSFSAFNNIKQTDYAISAIRDISRHQKAW